jgi:hypothetical protein
MDSGPVDVALFDAAADHSAADRSVRFDSAQFNSAQFDSTLFDWTHVCAVCVLPWAAEDARPNAAAARANVKKTRLFCWECSCVTNWL